MRILTAILALLILAGPAFAQEESPMAVERRTERKRWTQMIKSALKINGKADERLGKIQGVVAEAGARDPEVLAMERSITTHIDKVERQAGEWAAIERPITGLFDSILGVGFEAAKVLGPAGLVAGVAVGASRRRKRLEKEKARPPGDGFLYKMVGGRRA